MKLKEVFENAEGKELKPVGISKDGKNANGKDMLTAWFMGDDQLYISRCANGDLKNGWETIISLLEFWGLPDEKLKSAILI